jgi:hypothetical protein
MWQLIAGLQCAIELSQVLIGNDLMSKIPVIANS